MCAHAWRGAFYFGRGHFAQEQFVRGNNLLHNYYHKSPLPYASYFNIEAKHASRLKHACTRVLSIFTTLIESNTVYIAHNFRGILISWVSNPTRKLFFICYNVQRLKAWLLEPAYKRIFYPTKITRYTVVTASKPCIYMQSSTFTTRTTFSVSLMIWLRVGSGLKKRSKGNKDPY